MLQGNGFYAVCSLLQQSVKLPLTRETGNRMSYHTTARI